MDEDNVPSITSLVVTGWLSCSIQNCSRSSAISSSRKLEFCHYQTKDSLECHYESTLRYYVVLKHGLTDKMPFRGLFDKVSTDWTVLPLK
jgi:hypothetical protein